MRRAQHRTGRAESWGLRRGRFSHVQHRLYARLGRQQQQLAAHGVLAQHDTRVEGGANASPADLASTSISSLSRPWWPSSCIYMVFQMPLNVPLAVRNLLKVRHDVTEWRRGALNPEGLGTLGSARLGDGSRWLPRRMIKYSRPEATRAPCPRSRPAPLGHNQRWRGTPWSRCAHAPPDRPLTGPRT